MKKSLFILMLLFICCYNDNDNYNYIIENLNLNYVRDKRLIDNMVNCEFYDLHRLKKDSLLYEDALKKFYSSDIEIISYLLLLEKDSLKYNNWIIKQDPCSSLIKKEMLINNCQASLILIDNYILKKDKDTIIVPKYINKLNHNLIKKIYFPKSIKKTKKEYIEIIDKINSELN